MNTKAEAAEPAEFSVSDRLQRGACLALTHVADTWGSQEARGDYLLVPARRRYLLNELQIAIRAGRVRLFDAIGKRERGYRDDDADAVQRGVAQVLPASVNAWLEADGLPMLEQVERLAAATPEPVAAPAEAVTVAPKGVRKREMVKRHAARWPAIETDMKDAGKNGLAAAAKAGERGWREAAALEWARERSRLLSAPEPGTIDAVMGGGFPSRRHTLAR